MNAVESLSLRYNKGKLSLIDQTQLPHREEWVEIKSYRDMIAAIKSLKVRGAPLIGVAAALALAQTARSSLDEFQRAAQALKASRPTAINLMTAIDRMLEVADKDFTWESLEECALNIFCEDVELCQRMSQNGLPFVPDNSSLLTHCNTGSLATAGIGTALGVITQAHRQGKNIHVYVTETRPLLQGGRLTSWELEKQGVPYTLICDSMAADLMNRGKIAAAFVGADCIARNGDFANKVGTYSIATLAHYHEVPLYVVAPYTTLAPDCATGKEIPIEMRDAQEVRGVNTAAGKLCWSPPSANTYNPAFDVTPAKFVQGWIFDKGVLNRHNWERKFDSLARR